MKNDFERGLIMRKCAIAILAASSLLITGCASQTKKRNTKNSTKTELENKADKQRSSQKRASTTKSGKDFSEQTARIAVFNRKLRNVLRGGMLPTTDGLNNGSNRLNIRYTGDVNNYAIFYSVGKKAKNFNDDNVAHEIPYAEFTKRTYSTTEEAAQQIEHRSTADFKGLPTVSLGHNIQGYLDAGAGQRYLNWNEGNWSFGVHATALQGEKLEQMSKQIVSLLEEHMLPVPRLYGQVSFEVGNQNGQRNQNIIWQDEKTVFKLSAHNFKTAIKMAASVK